MAKMGRPKKEIDKRQFESLCGLRCTEEDICDFFECSPDTINRWCKANYKDDDGKPMTFAEVYKQKKALGRISLRRMAWALAPKSAAMLIFLLKNECGMTDSQQLNIEQGAEVQIYLPDNGRDDNTEEPIDNEE